MSRTADILQKALDELGATAEEAPAPSRLELLLAESIKLANLMKVAQRISHSEFVELFEEMYRRYEVLDNRFAYHSVLLLHGMYSPSDFADTMQGREMAIKAYKHLQICIAQLEIPA